MWVRVPLGVFRGTTGGTGEKMEYEKKIVLLSLNEKTLTNGCEHAAL